MISTRGEWAILAAAYVANFAAAILLKAADLALFATLVGVPLIGLFFVRRDMPLGRKLVVAGPLAYALPFALFLMLAAHSPGRAAYYAVGTICGLFFFVPFAAIVKLALFVRH